MPTAGEADVAPRERILAAIRAVPPGRVAGYGHIAHRAGLPGRARMVARVLRDHGDPALPWHRIVRSDGRIAFPAGSPGFEAQAGRLRAEGVAVVRGRVRMPVDDGLDAALWGPGAHG
ncbi:MGMT family protein [Luteimonas sp. FCS-9]|uniref:MGMT family protein n=1 Tax=Luteimonas sp. FCS-9 TaxID=1547516 RepID=UPI00063E9192|nr:MGMT family protein [Luteimonas sp. FCS-9]KLJ01788.1 cysteine methyltransferase [Luteimonas sp. FCS-9]